MPLERADGQGDQARATFLDDAVEHCQEPPPVGGDDGRSGHRLVRPDLAVPGPAGPDGGQDRPRDLTVRPARSAATCSLPRFGRSIHRDSVAGGGRRTGRNGRCRPPRTTESRTSSPPRPRGGPASLRHSARPDGGGERRGRRPLPGSALRRPAAATRQRANRQQVGCVRWDREQRGVLSAKRGRVGLQLSSVQFHRRAARSIERALGQPLVPGAIGIARLQGKQPVQPQRQIDPVRVRARQARQSGIIVC